MGLVDQVGLQIEQNLIVSEIAVFWQEENRLIGLNLILLIIMNFNHTLANKVHFLKVALIVDEDFVWGEDPAVQLNDQLIDEASFAPIEKVVERPLELSEAVDVEDDLCLQLGWNLSVEVEFFDDQVEVIQEGLLNIIPDVVVELGLDVVWLV